MYRLYSSLIKQHFSEHEQMLFLAGPRQVGKTTIAKDFAATQKNSLYLNYDVPADRQIIIAGGDAIAQKLGLESMQDQEPILVLDELHKYRFWKNFLKGFYDQYKGQVKILVTGSAKLNIYQQGGDSLMGRYLLYRVHPFSIAEVLEQPIIETLINPPKQLDPELLQKLLKFGGYPDPFIKSSTRFSNQWWQLRQKQLFREDIQNIKQIHDIPNMEMLAVLLNAQSGQMVNYSNLAKHLKIANDTVTRWINVLEQFYYCFKVTPWHKNVKRSLVKEPKIYLWDWSEIKDPGARLENFVACHLHKAIHFWTDHGLGKFKLHFLRDKNKREVDFLIVRDNKPWFMVEVKSSENNSVSEHLHYFHQQLAIEHSFQVVLDKAYIAKDCFDYNHPIIVPLTTFLSQLV